MEYRVTAVNARGTSNNSSDTAEGMTAGTATPGHADEHQVGWRFAMMAPAANTIYLYWNKPKNADVGDDPGAAPGLGSGHGLVPLGVAGR